MENVQESPLEFVVRKLKYICALYMQPCVPDPTLELTEVQRVLEDIPKLWYQHLKVTDILMMDELMQVMKFQELELTASDNINIYKIAHQVVKLDSECPPGRFSNVQANLSAAAKYEFAHNDFKSRKKPPQACRHCGSDLHWDNDCPPFKAEGRGKGA